MSLPHTALVLGSTGGLGSSISSQLQAADVEVLAHVHRSTSPPPGCLAAGVADLTTEAGRREVVSLAMVAPPSVVFMSFGAVGFAPLHATADHDLQRLFEVNAVAPLLVLRDLAPLLPAQASVVFLPGAIVDAPMMGLSGYAASKSALAAAIKVLRREYRNLRLLDARPPHTETGFASRALFGTPPKLPTGLDPDHVAAVLVRAALTPEHPIDLPFGAFLHDR